MRSFTTLAALLLVILAQWPMSASAHRTVHGGVQSRRVYHQQSEVRNTAKEVVLLPVRVVAGAVTAPVGAVRGMAQRTGDSVEWVNDRTFKQLSGTPQPSKSFGKGLVMVPVGVVGTAAALPVGVAVGAVEGSYKGFLHGFDWVDRKGW